MDDALIDTWSEAWRLECEARHVLNLKDKRSRIAYITRVRDKRGIQAAEILEGAVYRAWKLSKQETA